ncbi:MAG: sulfotransferase [Pseudomonadota bacterium]
MARRRPKKRSQGKVAPKLLRQIQRAEEAHRAGDLSGAEAAYLGVLRKTPGQREAVQGLATLYLHAGLTEKALHLVNDALAHAGRDRDLHLLKADLLNDSRDYEAARDSYLAAYDGTLSRVQAACKAAVAAGLVGREAEALAELDALLTRFPDDADVAIDVGTAARLIGDVELAYTCFQRGLGTYPNDPVLANNLGSCLVDLGRMSEAEAFLRKAVEVDPNQADAWYNLARVRRYTPDDEPTIARLEQALGHSREPRARSVVNFAIAKVRHDLGDYDQAFKHYRMANQIMGSMARYDQAGNEAEFRQVVATFTPEFCQRPALIQSDLPLLIVGMPRSGTTLVEQILSAHPAVHGAGELRDLLTVTRRLGQLGFYPANVANAPRDQMKAWAQDYVELLAQKGGSALRVTDKMPTNFLALGVASMMFGGLRVIHCRRNPMDTCFSNYIQYFAEGHLYSSSLDDVAHFYGMYRQLMSHWHKVLPIQILDVDYESVVDDVEREARRLVAFADLPWDDRCVTFHANERTVATASNWQVRQPIYTHSRQRWRRYDAHLQPLKIALQRFAPDLPETANYG